MQIRNLAKGTQVHYLLALKNLSKHYNHTPPEDLTDVQVQNYIHHLSCDQNDSWSLLFLVLCQSTNRCVPLFLRSDTEAERDPLRHSRGVFLPRATYDMLTLYWKHCRFEDFLFLRPQDPDKPMLIKTPQNWFKAMKRETGIVKKGCLHIFRHSYATHALEDGENLINVQRNLGHASIKATLIYTKLAQIPCQQLAPIDRLYAREPSTHGDWTRNG